MAIGALDWGETAGRDVSRRVLGEVADTTALAAVPLKSRYNGMLAVTTSDQKTWAYVAASSASASATVIVPADAPATGRWLKTV